MNVFQQSRRQLTLYYSLIMAAFLVVLIFFVHQSMEWSMESEQARELVETAGRIAGGQEYLLQHPELMEDAEDWRGSTTSTMPTKPTNPARKAMGGFVRPSSGAPLNPEFQPVSAFRVAVKP